MSKNDRSRIKLDFPDSVHTPKGVGNVPKGKPPRTRKELEPIALLLSNDLEFMQRFTEVVGSEDDAKALAMIDGLWVSAKNIDPSVTYPEACRIALLLRKTVARG